MPVRYDNSLAFGATQTPLCMLKLHYRCVALYDCHDANLKGERGEGVQDLMS